MTNRLIYLIGAPGSGKSTLMARLTDGLGRRPMTVENMAPVAHDALINTVNGEVIGAEIGVRRELFSGTDALPSSIIEKAIPWIRSQPYPLLFAEGARLANKRFLQAAFDAGYHVTLALLDHPDAETWREARADRIGRAQNPAWVKGRATADRNLADWAEALDSTGFLVLRGAPDDLYHRIIAPMATSRP